MSGPFSALGGGSDNVPTAFSPAPSSPSASASASTQAVSDSAPGPDVVDASGAVSVSATASPGPVSSSPGGSSQALTSSPSVLVPPDLSAAKGYSYVKAPAKVVKAFAPVADGQEGVLSAPTVRGVKRGDTPIGSVAAMSVEPNHLKDDDVVDTLLSGLVEGMSGEGYTLRGRTVTVDGTEHTVYVGLRKGSTIAAWLDDDSIVAFVSGGSESGALAFAKAYLA